MEKSNELWINIDEIANKDYNWNVFVGARRIGKTYGILKRFIENNIKFIFMRRTKEELARAVDEGIFNELNSDLGTEYNIDYVKSKGIGTIYRDLDKTEIAGEAIALSVVKSVRGVDYSWYDELFFDEVIPEEGTPISSSDGIKAVQAFETIFGNRELPPHNKKPMKVWLACNPISMFDGIMSTLNLVEPVTQMALNNQKHFVDPKRSLFIYFGTQSGVAELKKMTSLYKMIGSESELTDHILNGKFRGSVLSLVKKSVNLKLYKCICDIDGKIFIYMHKNDVTWYVTRSKCSCKMHFSSAHPIDFRRRFASRYDMLKAYDMIYYQSAELYNILDIMLG